MHNYYEIYLMASMCDTDPQLCETQLAVESTSGAIAKAIVLLIVITYVFAFSSSGNAGIAPTQAPVDTTIGGTGAAKHALEQLAPIPGKITNMQNLDGPNFGFGRDRQSIQVVKMTNNELPGIDGYFMRSSYVVLAPRGFAPIHSHARRPAYLQVVSGSITQHRSDGLSLTMGKGDFTFSSDDLAHWWMNESMERAIRLWIVEICNTDHGCKEPVNGGSLVLEKSSKASNASKHITTPKVTKLMSIDLPGEFKDTPELDAHELRLRRVEISPGESGVKLDLPDRPAFLRIDSGTLTMTDAAGDHQFPSHTIAYSTHSSAGQRWSNPGLEPAVLYIVDLVY